MKVFLILTATCLLDFPFLRNVSYACNNIFVNTVTIRNFEGFSNTAFRTVTNKIFCFTSPDHIVRDNLNDLNVYH